MNSGDESYGWCSVRLLYPPRARRVASESRKKTVFFRGDKPTATPLYSRSSRTVTWSSLAGTGPIKSPVSGSRPNSSSTRSMRA